MLPSPTSLSDMYQIQFPTNSSVSPTTAYLLSVRSPPLLHLSHVGPTSSFALSSQYTCPRSASPVLVLYSVRTPRRPLTHFHPFPSVFVWLDLVFPHTPSSTLPLSVAVRITMQCQPPFCPLLPSIPLPSQSFLLTVQPTLPPPPISLSLPFGLRLQSLL